jgi:hypothetical protein
MRTLKLALGIGCLLAAPLPAMLGVLALLDLSRLEPFRAFSPSSAVQGWKKDFGEVG